MTNLTLRIAAPLIALSAVVAQEPTRTLPAAAWQTWGNAAYSLGPNVPHFTLQNWYSGEHLPVGTVIHAIALRGHESLSSAGYTCNLEYTFENTAVAFDGLSPTLANNLTQNAVVAFTNKRVTVPALPASRYPNDARGSWVVLDTPFVFTGPNLILQMKETQRVSSGSQHRRGLNVPAAGVHRNVDHPRCGAVLTTSYDGVAYEARVTGVPRSIPVWFLFGTDRAASPRLPLDLSFAGIPGCVLGLDPQVTVGVTADSVGTASLSLPFPTPARSLMLSTQALHYTDINLQGFATTNTRSSVIGNTGSWNQVPSFDGTTAIGGHPRGYNNSATFLIR